MGLVVSTGSPVDTQQSDNSSSDKKKTAVEVICKDKNAELSRYDTFSSKTALCFCFCFFCWRSCLDNLFFLRKMLFTCM